MQGHGLTKLVVSFFPWVQSGGKLEIHVPRKFSRSRPPVHFSHVDCSDTSIDSHPLGSQLPHPTGPTPSIHEGCQAFRGFAVPDNLPNDIKHYWDTDQPLLCLHVTSFVDATLVGFTFPHSLSDAMGTSGLLRAWSSVVAAKSCNVRPPQGTWEDALAGVGTGSDKVSLGRFVLEGQQTRRLALASFIGRYVWDVATRRSIQTRHMYLPAKFVRHLRREVEAELRRSGGGGDGGGGGNDCGEVPFVSDGDVILAWGSRMVMDSPSWKGCSAVICNVFDLRGRLEGVFAKAEAGGSGGPFLQNLILPATTLLTRGEASTATVGQIAVALRQAIANQTSDEQARRLMRVAREWFASMGMMPLFARWDSRVIACTNWSRARLLEAAEVGPAAVVNGRDPSSRDASASAGAVGPGRPGRPGGPARPGRPVMYWGTTLSKTDSPRDTFVIYGKDFGGNYWVHGYLRQETWDLIRRELERFS
ncbi:hypothetical protein DHEL01_v212771 [Diaporthe helianthi]|uniref:BCL5p n=1 Tax=Diaporthe helianthi TaxID=158607 RepID=A0A2P5HEZ9_DIAHE|nr:hypothetical protein DHEL01_v212771 [Diaporthe helianthi]